MSSTRTEEVASGTQTIFNHKRIDSTSLIEKSDGKVLAQRGVEARYVDLHFEVSVGLETRLKFKL